LRVKVYEDENGYVLVDYLLNKTKVALHLTFNDDAWTHQKYKKYQVIFRKILDNLGKEGYTEVWATPFSNRPKSVKLVSMFGFQRLFEKHGHVVMNRKV
jgi:hypothetical protein